MANGTFGLSSPRRALLEDVPPRKAAGIPALRRNPPAGTRVILEAAHLA